MRHPLPLRIIMRSPLLLCASNPLPLQAVACLRQKKVGDTAKQLNNLLSCETAVPSGKAQVRGGGAVAASHACGAQQERHWALSGCCASIGVLGVLSSCGAALHELACLIVFCISPSVPSVPAGVEGEG